MVEAIRFTGDAVELIDQRLLPAQERWIRCETAALTADAIRGMVVRGAPAIGITAAYGYALAARQGADVEEARRLLLASRPTATNLRWALERLDRVPPERRVEEAKALHREDVAVNKAMGRHGAALLEDAHDLYSHCNTGALATGGWGTSLGVIRSAAESGRRVHVWVGETRPYLQGARLTAWELQQDGIPCTLVTDNAAAFLMGAGKVDAVLVGCDRVAANGDTANKIGTLALAVLAARWEIPFYVCMPTSTLDRDCLDGTSIPIEERDPDEVRGFGDQRWAADIPAYNPAFDVTPAELVTAWVTEFGVWRSPFPPANAAFIADGGTTR
ncbi:MAG: S-methyl-5-thioribose-1-phosphate isomerase [Deltaproteobacteria bacterium]|nr:S-methyl-5-thioribose-1-phosphate isomerase [Deltaproteobacteria bacterium]MBW2255848.1 S-methyl-5-thioribose-1-phosphate isomerase [Deltaproteobacteria bacterium]